MAKHDLYEKKTEKLIEAFITENQFEIYDIEYVKEGSNWYLRVFIDKEVGITVNDCELVSRALSDALDKANFIQESYILEVSSPGLGRQLKKDKHFDKSIGQEVEIKLYKPINKQKEWVGILTSYDANNLKLMLEDETEIELSRKDIAMVRLTIDF